MDAYEKCTNLGGKNLVDIVAIYGRGQELFRPPTYITMNVSAFFDLLKTNFATFIHSWHGV